MTTFEKQLSLCLESYYITENIQEILADATPDVLEKSDANAHSFMYTIETGLMCDPVPGRNHGQWYLDPNTDQTVKDVMELGAEDAEESPVASGRYGTWEGIPVACFWAFSEAPPFQQAARELLRVMPSGAWATKYDAYGEASDIMPLKQMAGVTDNNANRGFQYWQQRQTSESIVRPG